MRRPAPPPPSEEVELDYGSADAPSGGQAQEVLTNHVEASSAPVRPSAAGRVRKLLAYDTDDFDPIVLPAGTSSAREKASNTSQDLGYGSGIDVNEFSAAAGPSSPSHHATSVRNSDNAIGGATVDSSLYANPLHGKPHQSPPPPSYPPPLLPQNPDQLSSSRYAYDPSVPEFRPSLYSPAPPTLPTESDLCYGLPAPQSFDTSTEDSYVQPTAPEATSSAYDPPYDPQAPYQPLPYPPLHHLYPTYPPIASYPGYYPPPNVEYPYTTGYHPQMNLFQDRRLLKQQKKKEKKLRKREKKQAARSAAYVAHYTSHDVVSSSADAIPFAHDQDVAWIEDGKAQAVAMIRELHARGVPPQRLTERGVPLHMIEDCCVELGIAAQGQAQPDADGTSAQPEALAYDSAEKKDQSSTTQAEDELLAKQEQGIPLTPLEELRRKVLASRLARVAAASPGAAASSKAPASPTAAPSVFDRTATSGEADTLLSQIGESIRSLMRRSHEAFAAAQTGDTSSQPGPSSSRKRSYRDVDAVDHGNASSTADLAGGATFAAANPVRRQRISYADTFSRAAETPSGEVDLNAPVPDLPDLADSVAELNRVTEAVSRRRRPVAADFDTTEYSPLIVRPNRFVDVPSGLNTVVDLSDDDSDEDTVDALEEATGWKSAKLDLNMRDVLLLRQKTASEHYDNFCALNGLKPVGRALTPQQDGAARAIEVSDVSTPGGSVSKESLLAQVAASGAASLGSSTPSREDLLRKELEIKQLMRKIQVMEQRKSQQQTATPSPSVSPMPSRYLMAGAGSQARSHYTTPPSMPDDLNEVLATPVQTRNVSPTPKAKAPLQEESNAQQQSVSSSGMKLDPALQVQRENLLALLASKRKTANAGLAETATKQPDSGTGDASAVGVVIAPKQEDPNGVPGSGGIPANDTKAEELLKREEVSPPPSVVSRYRPLVPSLFQSVASKVRSYLPPSLGFTVASTASSSSSSGDDRTSVKWCPREACGGECADEGCSQRHVSEFDSHT
ncbi:hypothetical protein EX895_006134 [Sporisorium graminicola]|uniref:Uncharacterized protein n=1 Tax=Sporisorium graminicola TaxID=280036 RepID=A0A4U7KLS6_9BASI|nr:hypothetical protein EX895_006134 [Sporisorium graminicola]TKY85054.1 hypothetical protein EX895_006134 [Sporisorium graminicola]